MFIGQYHRSNLITYLGIAFAAFGICHGISGDITGGMICLILSGICDLFDGLFARRFQRSTAQKEFGIQIDSLADVVSFAVLPAVLLFSAGFRRWYHIPLLILYLFAALTRLAHFNTTACADDAPRSHYRGLPVTYAAFFFPVPWLLSATALAPHLNWVYPLLLPVLSFLYLWNAPVKKPRGLAYVLFAALAVVTIAAMLILG